MLYFAVCRAGLQNIKNKRKNSTKVIERHFHGRKIFNKITHLDYLYKHTYRK